MPFSDQSTINTTFVTVQYLEMAIQEITDEQFALTLIDRKEELAQAEYFISGQVYVIVYDKVVQYLQEAASCIQSFADKQDCFRQFEAHGIDGPILSTQPHRTATAPAPRFELHIPPAAAPAPESTITEPTLPMNSALLWLRKPVDLDNDDTPVPGWHRDGYSPNEEAFIGSRKCPA